MIGLITVSLLTGCKTADIKTESIEEPPRENTELSDCKKKYNDCADMFDDCRVRINVTTRQLQDANDLLDSYDSGDANKKMTWGAIGFGAGAVATMTILLGILLGKK